jgi:hypothetical protein
MPERKRSEDFKARNDTVRSPRVFPVENGKTANLKVEGVSC